MRIGAMTRPWNKFGLAETLDAIAAAGFDSCGLLRLQGQALLAADTPLERIDAIRAMCEERGIEPLMAICGAGLEVAAIRGELERLQRLGGSVLLHCGVMQEDRYQAFYEAMREAAPIAADLGLEIVLKPHGGVSATAADCVRALDAVDHEAFGLWYDPGNVKYYTGSAPVADVKVVAERIRGCCVKDCIGSRPGGDGDVNILPGDGEVDLATVFRTMREAGFDGPRQIECLGGETYEEVGEAAVEARRRLLGWLG